MPGMMDGEITETTLDRRADCLLLAPNRPGAFLDASNVGLIQLTKRISAEAPANDFDILFANRRALRMLQTTATDPTGTCLSDWMPAPLRQIVARLVTDAKINRRPEIHEISVPSGSGEQILRVNASPLDMGALLTLSDVTELCRQRDELRERAAELTFINDSLTEQAGHVVELAEQTELARRQLETEIEERKRLEAELTRLATTDPLTGAYNRRHFLNVAEDEISRALRYQRPLSVIMADIDRFKTINDNYGHGIGDLALKAMANLCNRTLRRKADLFGRLGGEEFAILLPETGIEGGIVLAERLRVKIASLQIGTPTGPLSFTSSFGVAAWGQDDKTIEDTLRRADDALYRAKEKGRNCVEEAA